MNNLFCQKLKNLAGEMSLPLYIVGGAVRGVLIDGTLSNDVDLASAMPAEDFVQLLAKFGFSIKAEYPRTHTVMFFDGESDIKYEFTSFRREVYQEGGGHTPLQVELTNDIVEDAKRRDFKCNAVYYDIKNSKIVDPLGGVEDIKNKILDTVKEPDKVFASDGLRLLRLCRFAGEIGFTPTERVVESASAFAKNVTDLSGERIYEELVRMLVSDGKYHYSPKTGHYDAFKLCHKIGVLKYIFPELSLGEGMPQRKDFHRYDVLEHSFRALLYSAPSVRLAGLLHDIGKAVVYLRDGTYHFHDDEGAVIARERLQALKAPRSIIEDTCWLILNHMYDLKADEPEIDVKRFIANNYGRIERLLLLKEADILASNPDLVPLTVVRWRKIVERMNSNALPHSIKDLKIDGNDISALGLKGKIVGVILDKLFSKVLEEPYLNERDALISLARKIKDDLI